MGLRRVSTNQDAHLLSVYEPTPIEVVQTKGEKKLKEAEVYQTNILYIQMVICRFIFPDSRRSHCSISWTPRP